MRIGVALAFFTAGLDKYRSFDYATQLFEQAYKIPLLAAATAGQVAMVNELTCSTLLLLGLLTRVATVPLLVMILSIQVVSLPAPAWPEHVLWGSVLIFLLTRGPGPLSTDYVIERYLVKPKHE